MNQPLVSVVIPSYRQAQFLSPALESVFAQTYPAVEPIVVNDGSDDDTETVAAGYGDRIRYIWKPNGGPSGARNVGLRAARGEYVLFLDGDDLLHPESLERLVAAVAGTGCDVAVVGDRYM